MFHAGTDQDVAVFDTPVKILTILCIPRAPSFKILERRATPEILF